MVNRYFILFAIVFAAALSGVAKTFDVDVSTGRPAASNEAYYHGETIEFRAVRGRSVVTNVEYSCIYYQTNGMDSVWWHTDGLVFHPTNDVGAASYRFFLEGRDDLGRDWHANGLLRLLPSPGFTPNTIELPVATLDFAAVEVANAPYYSKAETEAKIGELAPAPGDYANVSNAAMSAVQTEIDPTVPAWAKTSFADMYSKSLYQLLNRDFFAKDSNINTQRKIYLTDASSEVTVGKGPTGSSYPHSVLGRNRLEVWGDDYNHVAQYRQEGVKVWPWWDDGAVDYVTFLFPTNSDGGTFAAVSDIPSAAIESNRVNIASNSAAIAELTDTASTLSDTTATLSADKADRSELADFATPADVYRIVAGTNVVLVVTNYNSTVHAPSMKLQHLDQETGEYVTYWDEARGHGITLTNAMNYADGVAARLDAEKAPRAWSRTTSGLGADAPEGTTFISTPVTHISGGFEFEKKITAGGTVWTLCSTSLAAGSTTNGFFEISALDGTPVFSVEKTDSVLVGVNASAIAVVGNACVISVPAVADTHPFARVATTLVQPTWYKEDSDGMPAGAPASVTWSGQSGAWVATVDFGATPQGFVFFEYLQEGGVKIVNSAVVDLSQGVHYGGATYMPTVSGNELKFIRQ